MQLNSCLSRISAGPSKEPFCYKRGTHVTPEEQARQYETALDEAERMLGFRLERFLQNAESEPSNAEDFKRLATIQAFGAAWPRTEFLDTRTRALISVT